MENAQYGESISTYRPGITSNRIDGLHHAVGTRRSRAARFDNVRAEINQMAFKSPMGNASMLVRQYPAGKIPFMVLDNALFIDFEVPK